MKTVALIKVINPNRCRECPFLKETEVLMPRTTTWEQGYSCARQMCDNHETITHKILVKQIRSRSNT